MFETEIEAIPPLTPGEQSLLDMHSAVNILNVLRCELALLGVHAVNDDNFFANGLSLCESLLTSLHDRSAALASAARMEEYRRQVLDEVDARLAQLLVRPDPQVLADSVANIRAVFAFMEVRARELLARAAAPDRWENFETEEIRADFRAFFSAAEKASKGRFRIVYNAARQQANDYYVDLEFDTSAGPALWMPPVFRDVMRDLVANARKYTLPGGRITAALFVDHEQLHFLVEDNGRGIPADELALVVEFGRRASNVTDIRSLGGGFGLTKAFLVAKQFGGRFWIGSELGVGTRVRIQIPCALRRIPAAALAGQRTVVLDS
jgi:signal transduction histidine kinase